MRIWPPRLYCWKNKIRKLHRILRGVLVAESLQLRYGFHHSRCFQRSGAMNQRRAKQLGTFRGKERWIRTAALVGWELIVFCQQSLISRQRSRLCATTAILHAWHLEHLADSNDPTLRILVISDKWRWCEQVALGDLFKGNKIGYKRATNKK